MKVLRHLITPKSWKENSVQKKYPDEEIIFSVKASGIVTKDDSGLVKARKWGNHAKLSALVLTNKRLVFWKWDFDKDKIKNAHISKPSFSKSARILTVEANNKYYHFGLGDLNIDKWFQQKAITIENRIESSF